MNLSDFIPQLRKPRELDEFELAQKIDRADKAGALLQNEAFLDALSDVEAVYMSVWRNSLSTDTEVRERAWTAVGLLTDIKNQLVNRVRDGAAARAGIERALRRQQFVENSA